MRLAVLVHRYRHHLLLHANTTLQPAGTPSPRAGANKYNAKQLTNYCLNWLPTNTAKVYFCSFSKLYHSSSRRITISNRVITPSPIGELSIVISVCVCVHVCLCLCVLSVRDQIFGITRPIFTNFLCMLPMAVARSFSGGVLVPYVFPVLGRHHIGRITHTHTHTHTHI